MVLAGRPGKRRPKAAAQTNEKDKPTDVIHRIERSLPNGPWRSRRATLVRSVAAPVDQRMAIDQLEAVQLGGTQQWIRIRSTDVANPVLLLIQQGPGLPMINEVRRFGRLLALEQAYTVVYWDQRGSGRSLRRQEDRIGISLERMVGDTVSLLEQLRDRFGRKAVVAGFSFGATVGAYAAARRPDLVATLVAAGMEIDSAAADGMAYDFALASARKRGNRRAIRQLEAIGLPPHRDIKQFATRARWVIEFGGVDTNENYGSFVRRLLASLARSGDYSPGDILRTVRRHHRDAGHVVARNYRPGFGSDVTWHRGAHRHGAGQA